MICHNLDTKAALRLITTHLGIPQQRAYSYLTYAMHNKVDGTAGIIENNVRVHILYVPDFCSYSVTICSIYPYESYNGYIGSELCKDHVTT